MPGTPPDNRGIWYFIISLEAILILILAGGGITNFAKGRLAPWPTGIMVAGYCISIWLLPLAIWVFSHFWLSANGKEAIS